MVSHLFFYQLVLIALVWLCLMLQWMWPSVAAPCPTTPEPPPPVHTRAIPTHTPLRLHPRASLGREAAAGRSTPPPISAPTRTVRIVAGWAGVISAPTAIPMGGPGG